MAKTTVSVILTRIKRRIDYNISGDSDLDNLLVDIINDALKLIHQWLFDAGMYEDVGTSDITNVKTTADQAYIDISSTLAAMGDLIRVVDRINDAVVQQIPYSRFVELYPDPTANSARTPDHCAIWNNRLYLGPTPSTTADVLYVDFVTIPVDVTSSSTLPYKTKFDPLVIAVAREEYLRFFDASNVTQIEGAAANTLRLKRQLITEAAKNYGMVSQSRSRNERVIIAPRVPTS